MSVFPPPSPPPSPPVSPLGTSNVAVTVLSESIVTVIVEVPLAAPLQPTKELPDCANTDNVTTVPVSKVAVPAPLIPAGELVTVPTPVPALTTVKLYLVGTLVSLIITELLVASTVPLVLPERIEAVNVSAPSVVVSAVGVTEKEPTLLAIANDPELVPKSPELVIVQ